MSNSPSLSFGPEWMRPRGSNTSINQGSKPNNEPGVSDAPRFPTSSPSSPSLSSSKLPWAEMGSNTKGVPQSSYPNGIQHPSRHGSPLSFGAGSSNPLAGSNLPVDKLPGATGFSGYPKGASSFKNGFNPNLNGDPSSPHNKSSILNVNSNIMSGSNGFPFTNSPLGSATRLHHGNANGQPSNNNNFNSNNHGNNYGQNNNNNSNNNNNNSNSNNNYNNNNNSNNNSNNNHRKEGYRNHYSFKILRENLGGKKYTPEEMLEIWKEMESKGLFDQSEPLAILDEGISSDSLPLCFSDIQEKPISSEFRREKPASVNVEPHTNPATSVVNSLLGGLDNGDMNTNSHMNSTSATSTSKFSHLSRNNLESSNSTWSPFGNNGTSSLVSSANVSRVGTPIDENASLFGTGLSRTTSRVFLNNNNSTTSLGGNNMNINNNNNIHSGNIMNSPLAAPPGLSMPQNHNLNPIIALVTPDRIEWVYKDTNGNEQGPFTGINMHEWYINNWLTDDLLIRRCEETEFITLTDLIAKIGNSREPFLTSLPAVNKVITQQAQTPSYFDNMNFPRRTEDSLNRQILQQKSVSQLPQLQSLHLQNQTNSTWGTPIASPILSPWASPAQPTFGNSSSMFDLNNFNNNNYQSNSYNNQQNSYGMNMSNNQFNNGYDNMGHIMKQQPAIGNNIINPPVTNLSAINLTPLDANSILSPLKNTNNLYSDLASSIGSSIELGSQASKPAFDAFENNPVTNNDRGISSNNFDLVQENEDIIIKTPLEKPVSAIEPPRPKVKSVSPAPAPVSSQAISAASDSKLTKVADDKPQEQKPVAASAAVAPEKSKKNKKNKNKLTVSDLLPASASSSAIISTPAPAPVKIETVKISEQDGDNSTLAKAAVTEEVQVSGDESTTSSIETAPIAPWAKKDPVNNTKTLTLREIQELEAIRAKERKAKEHAANQAALIDMARAVAISEAQANAPILPSGAKWGSAVNPALAPKKTIAEIQREEVEAARKAPVNSSSNSLPPSGTSIAAAISSATNERKYADMATVIGPSKPITPVAVSFAASFAASLAASSLPSASSAGDGAWTTVNNSKKLAPAPIATAVTPVRPITSNATTTRSVTTDTAKSQSDEFILWCKTSLRGLDAGIDQTDLLSMFLSLPSSSETSEIIADSIYANSSTLDGRRFAAEFLKRRTTIEKEDAKSSPAGISAIKGSWSDILQRVQVEEVENSGWNTAFKVVGKKKNPKKI